MKPHNAKGNNNQSNDEKEETLEEVVARRNKRLLNFFTRHGFNVRIVGEAQKPAIVFNDMAVLSCYVKNFDLHFTKEPFSDVIVKSFKLRQETEATREEILEIVEQCTHRPVYKIRLIGTELYLAGYNYINSEDSVGRYPVFAKHLFKVYFDKEYAIKLVESLIKEGYTLKME